MEEENQRRRSLEEIWRGRGDDNNHNDYSVDSNDSGGGGVNEKERKTISYVILC